MIEMIINYDSDDDHNDNNDDDGDDDAVQNISYQANDESGGSISLQYSPPNAPETYLVGIPALLWSFVGGLFVVFTTQRSWNVFRWKYLLYFDHLWEECSIQ